ncbi:MAG: dicarboxylate/amino acid:cation symporter [Kofleriaceae bacterium]|nr:dicarboxylate/amino acid:cation symporter [Kofleriaceae bacterium]MCB9573382.1 dicarboxylate/amino acid:cation symporter [Kofleriaceae bacterium]
MWSRWRRLPLHWQILVAMALGLALGVGLDQLAKAGTIDRSVAERAAGIGQQVGKLFLALLSMLVVPLILSSLVSGVVGVPDLRGLRSMSIWTFGFYLISSLLAIATGILVVNLIRPGDGLDYATLHAAAVGHGSAMPEGAAAAGQAGASSLWDVLFRMVPENVIAASSSNRLILAVIFFAIMLGVFIKKVERDGNESGRIMARFFTALFDVMMAMTSWVVSLAPYGIAGFLVSLGASGGLAIAGHLGAYMLAVALGLVIHAVVTLPLLLWVLGRRSPLAHAKAMAPALMTAFSTASSNATLPLTLRCLDERARVDSRVSSFTIPLGATVNMDGTALYEAVAVLFIAQTLGDLSLTQQIVVVFMALAASVGAAGIPHAGTVMMVIVLQAVGLPTEAVIVILAVDRVLDMARTTVNVWSDSCGAAIVARRAAGSLPPPGETEADAAPALADA